VFQAGRGANILSCRGWGDKSWSSSC